PARLSSSYSSSRARGAVHSFPTRRSSDLPPPAGSGGGFGARARGADAPPPHSGCDRHLAGAERAAGGGGACLPQPAGGAGQPGGRLPPAHREGAPGMMKGVWAVVRMSFLTYFRDRSSVFWGILFPLLLMGLIGTVFGEASVQFDVAVVRQAEEAGWFSDWFVETLDQIEVFTVWEEASLDEALAALAEQRASLVVALPAGAWPDRPGTAGS